MLSLTRAGSRLHGSRWSEYDGVVDTAPQTARPLHWRKAALLSVGSVLFIWQLRHPVLRFASPVVNDVLGFVIGLGLPWLAAIAIFRIGRLWSKTVAILAVLPLLLYSFIFLLGSAVTGFAYKDGHDLSFDRFSETDWRGSIVRLYRTNGGATTDFGVVIRQERTLMPGLLLVRRVDGFYPCYSVDATSTELGITITDHNSECGGLVGQSRDYRLKPFIYF